MSIGYNQMLLSDVVSVLGEDRTQEQILSHFSCPHNADVERFLKKSAIPFSKQSIAATHLVFTSYKGKNVLTGYYTCANKYINIPRNVLSSRMRQRIKKFGSYDSDLKVYSVSAPLLAQISKNFTNGYNKLITGDELLTMALDKVEQAQMLIGGKIVYLECEDKPFLIDFYSRHGFVEFGKRTLEGDERKEMGEYLVQMLRYRND